MNFIAIFVIMTSVYLIMELYKAIFENNQKAIKLIPILGTILGAVLGGVIVYFIPEMFGIVGKATTAMVLEYAALSAMAGAAATGANQIFKQLSKFKNFDFNVEEDKNNNDDNKEEKV